MPDSIAFKASATRKLAKLPREVQLRFLFAFSLLALAPTKAVPGLEIKQMRGHPSFWCLAVGRWRGVYHFDGAVIRFHAFGARATIYAQFESTV